MQNGKKLWWWGVVALGGLSLLSGLLCFPLAVLVMSTPDIEATRTAILVFGLGWIGIVLGILLIWHGVQGGLGKRSSLFYFPLGAAICVLVGIFSLIGTQVISSSSMWELPFLALSYTGAIATPIFFFYFLATWAGGKENVPTLRQVLLALLGGAGSTLPAIVIEVLGCLYNLLVVYVLCLLIPEWKSSLISVIKQVMQLANSSTMDQTVLIEQLGQWMTSPPIFILIVLTISVLTPLVEELGKGLVVGVLGHFKKVSPQQAFLWGAAAGFGFALVEGIGNGLNSTNSDVSSFLVGAGSRVFASVMHACTTGMIGVGWAYFWRGRRLALPLAYGGAVVFHGLWNFCVVLIVTGSVSLVGDQSAFMVVIALVGVLLLMALAGTALLGIVGLPLFLRSIPQPAFVPAGPLFEPVTVMLPENTEASLPAAPEKGDFADFVSEPDVDPFSQPVGQSED